MTHETDWLFNGLPERFSKLKVIWIESGLAWVPFLMQRLDHEYGLRTSDAPLLTKRPSEYMREMFYTSQPLEVSHPGALAMTLAMMDAEHTLLYSSDWPHWDFDPPSRIMTIGGLSNTARDNILGRNSQRLVGIRKLPEPSRPLHSPADTSVERADATSFDRIYWRPMPNSDQYDAVERIS